MFFLSALSAFAGESAPLPPGLTLVPHDSKIFRADPTYTNAPYSAEAQIKIYGDKRHVPTTRPLIELGRELYREGPFQKEPSPVGKKNLVIAHLLVSGDWRTALAYNDTGASDFGALNTRLNLDVDLKFTATERFHAFFRPLDHNGKFTGIQFGHGTDRE